MFKHVVVAFASFRLIRSGKEHFIEDESDGTMSSPLHKTMVDAIKSHPESLLDIQLLVATRRPQDVPVDVINCDSATEWKVN